MSALTKMYCPSEFSALHSAAIRSPASADHPLDFLRANPQLTKLSLAFAVPNILLDEHLLPLLSQSFSRLESFSLKWEGAFISKTALAMTRSLTSLEQIHLSVGEQYGWKSEWLINHKIMRSYLRKLPCLRKVALSRDTYPNKKPDRPNSCCYEDRFVPDAPFVADRAIRDRLWETKHRTRMLKEGNKYARVMPKLEWLYFGQLVMGIQNVSQTGEREASALSHKRDDCYTLLHRMFELGEMVEGTHARVGIEHRR